MNVECLFGVFWFRFTVFRSPHEQKRTADDELGVLTWMLLASILSCKIGKAFGVLCLFREKWRNRPASEDGKTQLVPGALEVGKARPLRSCESIEPTNNTLRNTKRGLKSLEMGFRAERMC